MRQKGWLAEEHTPVAVARINSSHLRASILRQTAAPADVAAVVAVAVAAAAAVAAADVVVAAAADVGIASAATSRWSFQLAEPEQLVVAVAGGGVEIVEREGLEGNCWGR